MIPRSSISLAPAGWGIWLSGLAIAFGLGMQSASAMTQTFTLQPGWNAIFLEVEPANTTPASVFAGLPIDSVWSFFPTSTPIEYLQDPAEGLFNVPGWNVYLPSSRTDAAALTNLFAVRAQQAYLVKINGTNPVTLTVTGTPSYREIRWQPDSFTLTGLPLDPAASVRSGDFFFNSTAHKSQPRYRLDPNGTWIALNDSSILKSGAAYWIFTKGGSDFTAPLQLMFSGTDRLDYGTAIDTRDLTITNRGVSALDVAIANPGGLPLVVSSLDPTTGEMIWTPLSSLTRNVPVGGTSTLTLGIRRAGLTGSTSGILTFSAQGILRTVAVSAENPIVAGPAQNAGLWIGTVTLNAVSEPHSANPSTPTATTSEFKMRLLLHVDATGATRLLKEAILMKQPNPPGNNPPVAGALVLLSNAALIPQFVAPETRDGSPFAHRVSSIGYDFSGADALLGGTFGGTLTGTLTVGRDLPTNPFKHRYHPDHDGLTASYQTPPALPPSQEEVWTITRAVVLTFSPPPAGDMSPEAGYSEREGTYRETVTSLHKTNLITTGTFALRRVNTLSELNPAPAP